MRRIQLTVIFALLLGLEVCGAAASLYLGAVSLQNGYTLCALMDAAIAGMCLIGGYYCAGYLAKTIAEG